MDTVANVSAQQGVVTVEYVGTTMDHGTGSEKTLLGVVLAGGRSSRMGQDKALLELLDGTTLLECQLRRLSSLLPKVVLSVRDRDYAFLQKRLTACGRVRLLPDETDEIGPLGGIASALGEAEKEHFAGILVLPCDMPLITEGLLARLTGFWHEAPETLVTALEESSGRVHPLAAIWSVRALPFVRKALASGDYSLRRAVDTQHWRTLVLDPKEDVLLANANTPREWQEIRKRLASDACGALAGMRS